LVVDDYLRPELQDLSMKLRNSGTPWLPVKPVGLFPWFGPLFQQGDGPCMSCLEQRLKLNRDTEEFVREATGSKEPFVSLASISASTMTATSMAVTEITRFIVTGATSLSDTLVTINTGTPEVERHTVVKRPQCPDCGNPEITHSVH